MSSKNIYEIMVDVFSDTMKRISEDSLLSDAIKKTVEESIIYQDDELPIFNKIIKKGELRVTNYRTIVSAKKLVNEFPLKRVGALNFANAFSPGGGVEDGSLAQEESLCRVSTLYPCLFNIKVLRAYYYDNRKNMNVIGDNKVVYSPNIYVIKEDALIPYSIEKEDYYKIDIFTCAAPDYRNMFKAYTNEEDEYKIHFERAKHILSAALANNIDILILGAFGCGAFKNHPHVVAKAYKDVLKNYLKYFEVVEFAIYTKEEDTSNYDTFKNILLKD